MIFSNNLGYPRIGKNRELKFAIESYWKNRISIKDLLRVADEIQVKNWQLQQASGIDLIPGNDFSLYDHVLDTALMVGAIPPRFEDLMFENSYELYFAMARGAQKPGGNILPAMEMTKWFNTNYHYIVPEISKDTHFKLNGRKPLEAFNLSKSNGISTKPVLLGPVSFLLLSKSPDTGFGPLEKIDGLFPLFDELLIKLKDQGAEWVQIDEPCLCLELAQSAKNAYTEFFDYFSASESRPRVLLTTYFADPSLNLDLIKKSPFEGLHLDLTKIDSPLMLIRSLESINTLSLGVINGRNIWRQDLHQLFDTVKEVRSAISTENLLISPSCSMIHVPQDVEMENGIDDTVKSWLSFADQKLQEISTLKTAVEKNLAEGKLFSINRLAIDSRRISEELIQSSKTQNSSQESAQFSRFSSFNKRKILQKTDLALPLLPTTTIGSFPQTSEVRKARSRFEKGEMKRSEYEFFLKDKIREAIRIQEEIGLDVLVHGEFERNDMVQYFGEKIDGFAFTEHGWVQSFGSRYVRPPIIHSYIRRRKPMTVKWSKFAQSLTDKPVKGMLTGPVTILQWSFARDDQPRSETCRQIAFAIREELKDLEDAGIKIIQIDEPALREGLPLQKSDWNDYLEWAVECFKIASSGVKDKTQIHTHMCYSEFNDIIKAIADMDADVISIEASRSKMELLDAFNDFDYPNEIGPGVYDIHSPNIPKKDAIADLIKSALDVIPAEQLWVNPDCGLKTRTWDEVIPSLKAMVQAALFIREDL